ncbi:unnamed protein product [Fraxinus pennsylvanica]|uniref:Uncharacterized protein n=1 Tax=Fraxinus pennsylvanica TaxID=56036 RepID=A0AAD1YVV5_9LAMI|nr:unnamed protein product [Fraxinus pennsylvanica]
MTTQNIIVTPVRPKRGRGKIHKEVFRPRGCTSKGTTSRSSSSRQKQQHFVTNLQDLDLILKRLVLVDSYSLALKVAPPCSVADAALILAVEHCFPKPLIDPKTDKSYQLVSPPSLLLFSCGSWHEDSSWLKYKDSKFYIPNGQAKTSEMWKNPRDISSLQPEYYCNMPGQTPHASHAISPSKLPSLEHLYVIITKILVVESVTEEQKYEK